MLQLCLQALQQQKLALTHNDLGALESQNQLTPALSLLEQATQARCDLLKEWGYNADRNGLELALQEHAPTRLNEELPKLLDTLAEFEKVFLSTRYLLHKSQQRVSQAMRVLRGHNNSPNQSTYSASGDATLSTPQNNQLLAQA